MTIDFDLADNKEPEKFSELSPFMQFVFSDRQRSEKIIRDAYNAGELPYNTYIQAIADLRTRKISGNL